jgi:hypothetical protein
MWEWLENRQQRKKRQIFCQFSKENAKASLIFAENEAASREKWLV